MLGNQSKIPRAKKATAKEEKGKYVSFELKTRVGQVSDSTHCKKYIRKFKEGSSDMLKVLEEIWTQNSMTRGTDFYGEDIG
jgi:hypothetical protein